MGGRHLTAVQNWLNTSAPSGTSYLTLLAPSAAPLALLVLWPPAACAAQPALTLHASLGPACPVDCSGPSQGHCSATSATCVCVQPYSGPDCSRYLDVLAVGEERSATLERALQWHYYELNVTRGALLSLLLTTQTPAVPLTLFVQYQAPPTLMSYYRSALAAPNALLQVGDAQPLPLGLWYAGVVALGASHLLKGAPYDLTFNVPPDQCLNNCTDAGHGTCVQGVCVCTPPYVLADCSARDQPVQAGRLSGSVRTSEWQYYHIALHVGNALLVEVSELTTVGNVWLFVLVNGLPTLDSFSQSDTQLAANHSILLRSTQASGSDELHIGVYGSALMSRDSPAAAYELRVSTGCSTYNQCTTCVSDPDCGWCFTNPVNVRGWANCLAVCVACLFCSLCC